MKNKTKIYQEDYYLFIIFIMMSTAILLKSYFNFDGYLSSDSTNYLTLAQNLLEGKGYYLPTSPYASPNSIQDKEFFAAIWPAGYSTLIFIIAKYMGVSVFLASKFLNIILIGIILGIFRSLFKENAYVYGLILFFSAYIEIFTYTWSESLFITAILWFSTSMYFFMLNPKKVINLYLAIIFSSLLLFMSRYIGAFSFGLIGLLGLYYALIKKERKKGLILIAIAMINTTIMVVYLYHNYIETGYITGMQRIPSWETKLELLYSLQKAILSETLIVSSNKVITLKSTVMHLLQMLTLFFLFWKYSKNKKLIKPNHNNQAISLSLLFTIIGIVYLFFIILMRWITQFDAYNFRLLGPGSFLLFIALISFIQEQTTKEFFTAFKLFIFSFALLSFIVTVPYKTWKLSKYNPIYLETKKEVEETFKNIEKKSIVIFAPKHLNYMNVNIKIREPASLPYSRYKETWSKFIQKIEKNNHKSIYVFIPKEKFLLKVFDKSVMDFLNQYEKGTLVKLR